MAVHRPPDLIEEIQRSLRSLSDAGWRGFDCAPETLQRLAAWSRPVGADAHRTAPPRSDPAETTAAGPPGHAAAASAGEETLDDVRADLGDCRRCKLCEGRRHIVFGAGDSRARLVFVGEGPGQDEDRQGEPFVGAAGQLLTRIIAAMGLGRESVYICNVIKCRPPGNRNPEPDEVAACLPFLRRQLLVIRPAAICALGAVAAGTLLGTDAPLGRLRGRFHDWEGTPLMPTYHPAYLLRNPGGKRAVWEDVQQIMDRLGLKRPG